MNTSLFELFKIGIGPSSSHTVGPMRAAQHFARELSATELGATGRVVVDLYGSLALTGHGHATDRAIILGLSGYQPDTVPVELADGILAATLADRTMRLNGTHSIAFHVDSDLLFHRDQMYPETLRETHPNGLRITAFDAHGQELKAETYYSVGGGFVLTAAEFEESKSGAVKRRNVPYAFSSAAELLALGHNHNKAIAEIVFANEIALLDDAEIARRIERILSPERPSNEDIPRLADMTPQQRVGTAVLALWREMSACIERGKTTEGILPGGLNVRRRAPVLAARLARMNAEGKPRDPLAPLDEVTLAAMAVNEENAAGGRVVTAPTNGAAGVVPAVADYWLRHIAPEDPAAREKGLLDYLLTAAAIGILYKENASISGAEVGCQGEVGVACSMAAGGLAAAMGGDNDAVCSAAEIAMEHNLGMTCDPIGGLVQIPCIERNGMGAVKAVNAARLALADQGAHKISLDQVIETMYRTGMDMQSRYKETSLAGLALNIIEC